MAADPHEGGVPVPGRRWRQLRDELLAYEEDHALSAEEEAAFARVRKVLGESRDTRPSDAEVLAWAAGTQRDAIWQAWNELPDGAPNAVQVVSARLGLPVAAVAATVYPEATFGASCPVCGGAVRHRRCVGNNPHESGCGWVVGDNLS